MNKILNVNLGGYALTIDDDAYEYLHRYLEAIRSRFSASEGRDEILGDIESRMGELLHQKLTNRTICTITDVQSVVKVMGQPEDFGDAAAGNTSQRRQQTGGQRNYRSGRRFFRDEDDKVVGGVCSGLAAYLGINDPVWVRLAFVLLAFGSAGFWVVAYIILMVVVPAALTSADRLAMRGEPINVDNIAREIENSFEHISSKVSGFGDDFKKKSKNYDTSTIKGLLSQIINFIGQVMGGILRLLGKMSKGVAFIIAGVLVIALLISWLVGFWSFFEVSPHLHYFSPLSQAGNISAMIIALTVIGLPVVSFFIMLLSAIFKGSISKYLQPGIWIVWTVCFVALVFFAAKVSKAFKQKGYTSTETKFSPTTSDTLYVQWSEQDLSKYNFRPFDEEISWVDNDRHHGEIDGLLISDDALAINLLPELRIAKSLTDQFELLTEVHARGSSKREADEYAQNAGFKCDIEGNNLYVPKTIIIPKGQKFRTFDINVDLKVPVGKYVVLGESINKHVQDADFDNARNNRNRFHKAPNQVFLMTKEGLVCVSCDDFGKGKYESDEDHNDFSIEGPIEIEFTKDDEFSLDLNGATEKDISFTRTDESLRLINRTKELKRVTVRCSEIKNLSLKNGVKATVFGFDQHEATILMESGCQLTGKLDISVLDLRLRDRCKLDLMGNGGTINLSIADNSNASLFNFKTDEATVQAKTNSTAELFVENNADVLADESSKVKVSGGAEERAKEKI